jgi:hypothetical protein
MKRFVHEACTCVSLLQHIEAAFYFFIIGAC